MFFWNIALFHILSFQNVSSCGANGLHLRSPQWPPLKVMARRCRPCPPWLAHERRSKIQCGGAVSAEMSAMCDLKPADSHGYMHISCAYRVWLVAGTTWDNYLHHSISMVNGELYCHPLRRRTRTSIECDWPMMTLPHALPDLETLRSTGLSRTWWLGKKQTNNPVVNQRKNWSHEP